MARFLLIGLDGAEPSLAGPWMDAGLLPNLAALRARGAFLPLRSTKPPVTYPAWTTCVSGVNPGKHGIFDFTEVVPGAYRIRFINSSFRRVPALWNVISEAGGRVCVLGVPGTYPPEAVNGVMLSGFDSPVATGVDASFAHPPSLYPELRAWRFADLQESHIGPGWHDRALPALLAKAEDKAEMARKLLARESWDFFMVVFGESDTVSHHFWLFHDPASPRHRPGHETAIQQVYQRLDRAVGDLVGAAGPDTVVAVVSDHGFTGASDGVVHLNNWLAENGYLRFQGGDRSLVKQAALRYVPVALRGALFRRFKGAAERAEGKSRFGGIDWSATTAWSEELNYFPSIRVNLEGRDPSGQVPASEYDAFVERLCRHLESWDAIAEALPRTAIYHGEAIGSAPDIVLSLKPENGYLPSCLRSRGGAPFRRMPPHEHLGGKERGMNGVHRDPGILLLSEPTQHKDPSLLDIAPTVLGVLGIPGPPMEGRSLLDPASQTLPAASSMVKSPYTKEEEAVLEQRLRDLGYLE